MVVQIGKIPSPYKVRDAAFPLSKVLLKGSHFSQGSDTYRVPMVLCCSEHPEISAVKLGDVGLSSMGQYKLWYAMLEHWDNGINEWLRGMPVANEQLLFYGKQTK